MSIRIKRPIKKENKVNFLFLNL